MKVMFVFMLKLLRHFVPPPSSPARGEVPRRGDGEGEQRRSWFFILKTESYLALPLFIEGVRRSREGVNLL